MADWVTATSARKPKPSSASVQATTGSSWANAAGRKAGNGTVQSVGRAPVQSKEKSAKRAAPVDPAASQHAAMRAIAKEALEHAMESRGPPPPSEPSLPNSNRGLEEPNAAPPRHVGRY